MVAWGRVTRGDVLRAAEEYDRLGAEGFFSAYGFGPARSYELVISGRQYPSKAILGAAYELATGPSARATSRAGRVALSTCSGSSGSRWNPPSARAREPGGPDACPARMRKAMPLGRCRGPQPVQPH
jgi:hypothetical protein